MKLHTKGNRKKYGFVKSGTHWIEVLKQKYTLHVTRSLIWSQPGLEKEKKILTHDKNYWIFMHWGVVYLQLAQIHFTGIAVAVETKGGQKYYYWWAKCCYLKIIDRKMITAIMKWMIRLAVHIQPKNWYVRLSLRKMFLVARLMLVLQLQVVTVTRNRLFSWMPLLIKNVGCQ